MNILIDLFDHSGNSAAPYRQAGWNVIQVDIKHGIDILTWDYKKRIHDAINRDWFYSTMPKIGLIAMIPCTDYATSGAKHFAKKDQNGETEFSQRLTDKVYEIKRHIEEFYSLSFWQVENPRTRIHTLNPWLGKIAHKFNPCNYAGYINITIEEWHRLNYLAELDMKYASKDDIALVMKSNRYNKETWLFGKFNIPKNKHLNPTWKDNPGWRLYGGKSERTKELRSVTPIGFCQAFYEANH